MEIIKRTGIFITIEGLDGSGKSTQAGYMKTYLESKGCDVVLTREPGGTYISEKIRDIILDKGNLGMEPMAEALLYAASRAQHVTYRNTGPAIYAIISFKHNLIFFFKSFRICTPSASQRTTFEKYQSSYTRSVKSIVFLDIEYQCFSF